MPISALLAMHDGDSRPSLAERYLFILLCSASEIGHPQRSTHNFSKQTTMPSVSDICYSREVTVAAIRDYYRFLVSMYLDEFNVLEPPKGGWPSIPPNGWKNFDKTMK